MLENDQLQSLVDNTKIENDKMIYIKNKIKRKGIEYLSINELNYIRELNDLPKIEIKKLKDILYNYYIPYSEINKETGISRTMLCMILRENRNCTIKKLKQLLEVINKKNDKITLKDLVG